MYNLGAVLLTPIAEELAFRGYLIRKLVLVSGDFEKVIPHFTLISFFGSSVLFGFLHSQWIAGTLAGIAKRELRGVPTHAVKSPADLDGLADIQPRA